MTMMFKKENLTSANLASYAILLFTVYITVKAVITFVEYGQNAEHLAAERAKIASTALKIEQEQNRVKTPSQNINADYYINSIYAYAMLQQYKVEILQKPSKYTGFVSLEVMFANLSAKEIVDFANTLKHLGFIEKVESNKIAIHVAGIAIDKVKEIINTAKHEKQEGEDSNEQKH